MAEIPSVRLIRSVFIVRNDDKDKVVELLERYNARYFVRKVILEKEDGHLLEINEEE